MSLMSKLLMSSIVTTLIVSAGTFDIEKFVKKNVVKNPQVKVKNVETIDTKKIPGDNSWNAYLVMVNLTFKGKAIKEPMTIFVDEKSGLATMALMDANKGTDYQRVIKPSMPESYYNEEHLIAGDKSAKHKMVIFSDPQCPFCIQYVPGVLKDFKEKKGDVALYYYHMPLLRLHPVSEVLTRVMEVLQKEGKIDQAIVDLEGFSFAKIENTNDPNLLPGALKYGGLPGIARLIDNTALQVFGANAPKQFNASAMAKSKSIESKKIAALIAKP